MARAAARHVVVGLTCALTLVTEQAAWGAGPGDTGTIVGEVQAKPSKYRTGAVVHLVKVAGSFRPPAQPAEYDQRGMQFVPRVLAVLRGTPVRFLNNDSVRHNIFSPDHEAYNLGTWAQGESQTRVFGKSGVYRQLCNVHPEMEGFIVVLDNPFFAVTDANGRFRIEGVPPGAYTVRAWSEKLPEATQPVTVTPGATAQVRIELKK